MNNRTLKKQVDEIKRDYQALQKEVDALIWELAPMASPDLQRKLGMEVLARVDAAATSAHASQGLKSRAFPTEVQEQVKQALLNGATIDEASQKFGPSTFTIKAWKRTWGLVRPRKK